MSQRILTSVHAAARTVLGAFVVLLPLGCGGGSSPDGGGGGLTNAVFNGTYVVAAFVGLASPAAPANADYRAAFGPFTANGTGGTTDGSGFNNDGFVTPPALGDLDSYSVAPDGTLAMSSGATTGGIRTDGEAAVAMLDDSGASPSVFVFLRPSGPYTNASFTGSFHLAQIFGRAGVRVPTSLFTTTALGALVADGAGGVLIPTMNRNVTGFVDTVPGGAAAYTVAANGALTLALLNGNYLGGLSPDGTFAIAGGGTVAGQDPQMAVMIKRSTLLTNAAFSGDYWAVGIASDPSDQSRWTSFTGTVTANGAGAMSFTTTENYEGTISANSGPDTYAVAGDGSLTSTGGRVGAVSADGRYAFLSGSLTPGVGPLLFVFVRK